MNMSANTPPAPTFDALEPRHLLSGDVSVSAGEVLQLRGDGDDNAVRITRTGGGQVIIKGLRGTTINGRNAIRVNGNGIKKVDIKLFGGNDTLIIQRLVASNDINIETDIGNDTVKLVGVRAGKTLSVNTGDGNDVVSAVRVRTGEDFNIDTGDGTSRVHVNVTTVGGSLTVIGKDGADRVKIANTTVQKDLNVEVGEGNDNVRLIRILSRKNIKVDAQTGNDVVAVIKVRAVSDAVFLGGDGFDTFINNGVSGGEKLDINEFNRHL
jgi:hypothetical protein